MYIPPRSVPVCVILTIVTCGIYGLYWLVVLTNEINTVTETPGDTSGGVTLLLSLVTCSIYGIYWGWKMGDKLDNSRAAHGVIPGSFPILFLVLNLFGLTIVSMAIMQNELNKYTPAP